MRVVGPLLTQQPMMTRIPTLMTLEGLGQPKEGAPAGYTDWQGIATTLAPKIANETNPAAQQILKSGLALATSSAAIPGVGWLLAGGAALVTGILALVGVKGTTQHVDAGTSSTKGQAFAAQLWAGVKTLPADAKQKFYELTAAFDADMWNRFSSWWGGQLTRDRTPLVLYTAAQYAAQPNPDAYWTGPYNIYTFYFYELMHNSDAATVADFMQNAFFSNISNQVLKPLDQFMLQKYNQTVAQYQAAHPTQQVSKAGVMGDVGTFLLWGSVVGGIGWALQQLTKKKRHRRR